jgi:hypothetical protein
VEEQEHPSAGVRGTVRDLLVQALGARELARVALALILLLGLAIPIAYSLRIAPIVPSVCGFALVLIVSRVPLRRRAALITILVAFAVFVAIQVFIVQNHFVVRVSDFETQWRTAVDYAQHGLQAPTSPQTQRAIPFYYPLVSLFGSSASVYLVANVVLTSLTYLMSVWIARRFFDWSGAAKTAVLLVFGFEAYFANTIPSHDVLGSFGVVLFLVLLVEVDVLVRVGRFTRARTAILVGLVLSTSLAISWVEWQRNLGMFCTAAALFYGLAAIVQGGPRSRLRVAIAIAVCLLSFVERSELKRRGLSVTESGNSANSLAIGLVVFGSDEGSGRYADWYRNHRVARALAPEEVERLARMTLLDTLRTNPGGKYENYLDRAWTFLQSGNDSGWYLTVESPEWLSERQLRKAYASAAKRTPPIWWAIGLLAGIAAILRRELLFDVRHTPLVLLTSFLIIMGMTGEAQSRYALFMVFLWPIYAGAPFLLEVFPSRWLARTQVPAPRVIARLVARVAISITAIVAIPIAVVWMSPALSSVRLANLEHADVAVDRSPWSAGRTGTPPRLTIVRNLLAVSDDNLGSEGLTITVAASISGQQETNTLHFVLVNELGGGEAIPRRALRVVVDGSVVQTIDLRTSLAPREVNVPGLAAGVHDVKLELDLGERGTSSRPATGCAQAWTSLTSCTNTTIAYLGFY